MSDNLIRDPADWARSWGWVSRLRAARAATRLRNLADDLERSPGGEEWWVQELLSVANYLSPKEKAS